MVTKYGMSELGPINFSESRSTPDGQMYESSQMFSQESNRMSDEQIKKLLSDAHNRTEHLIKTNKKTLDAIANALLERETIEYEEYEELVRAILPIPHKKPVSDEGVMPV